MNAKLREQPQFEIMVMVQNSADFLGWPHALKLDYYRKAVLWHDYIAQLQKDGDVTQAWGVHRVTGRVDWSETKSAFVAIYKVPSLGHFDALITKDPLWDHGRYFMPLLDTHEEDLEVDLQRYKRARAELQARVGRRLPKPILKYKYPVPKRRKPREGSLEIIVHSKNSAGFEDMPDSEKLDIYERVVRMHDYHRQLRAAGLIVQEWGQHQHCGLRGTVTAEGTIHYQVDDYAQFDEIFIADPVRDFSRVWTVILQPLASSRQLAEQELVNATARLK